MGPLSTQHASKSFPPSAFTREYDVFLSFNGDDSLKSVVDGISARLIRKNISVFRDGKGLQQVKEILPEFKLAIKQSRLSMIIFSDSHALSTPCSLELDKTLESAQERGHPCVYVLYSLDPSLKGKIQRWWEALARAINLPYSRAYIRDFMCGNTVNQIIRALKPQVESNLVGINSHMKEMNAILRMDLDEIKFIAIIGPGGIGKSTIAKLVYRQISFQFNICSYLENVGKSLQEDGLLSLQYRIFSDMCGGYRDPAKVRKFGIRCWLHDQKVLIILDDVDQLDQLQYLAAKRDWFGPGSRIIIITENENLLDAPGVDGIHKVMELGKLNSLELFSWKAFEQDSPPKDFFDLSLNMIHYAHGLPLALSVLGSLLRAKSKTTWFSVLDRLKILTEVEIMDILRISYDWLEDTEKTIFSKIACFHLGKPKTDVIAALKDYFCTDDAIQVLVEKSLITISKNDAILMHDLVQEMGINMADPGDRDLARNSIQKTSTDEQ